MCFHMLHLFLMTDARNGSGQGHKSMWKKDLDKRVQGLTSEHSFVSCQVEWSPKIECGKIRCSKFHEIAAQLHFSELTFEIDPNIRNVVITFWVYKNSLWNSIRKVWSVPIPQHSPMLTLFTGKQAGVNKLFCGFVPLQNRRLACTHDSMWSVTCVDPITQVWSRGKLQQLTRCRQVWLPATWRIDVWCQSFLWRQSTAAVQQGAFCVVLRISSFTSLHIQEFQSPRLTVLIDMLHNTNFHETSENSDSLTDK